MNVVICTDENQDIRLIHSYDFRVPKSIYVLTETDGVLKFEKEDKNENTITLINSYVDESSENVFESVIVENIIVNAKRIQGELSCYSSAMQLE